MPLKLLLEMRPALDGFSGIPQETRLLFRGLASLADFEVHGLLQSSNLVLEDGLALDRSGHVIESYSAAQRIERLSNVVVSLQQGAASHRLEHLRKRILKYLGPSLAAMRSLYGGRVSLSGFQPQGFEDFIWRALFAKSLPVEDFALVTQRPFRVMRWPWSMHNAIGVASGALGRAVYPRLDTRNFDVMVAETPYPGRVSARTALVVRYHDAIPLLMPHTIKDRGYHRAMHFQALRRNVADGAWFACVSESSRTDLLSIFPDLAPRAVTIPNMVSHHYRLETGGAGRVPEIIWGRKNREAPSDGGAPITAADLADGQLPYLLAVSTLEPRKNHLALLDAWELLRFTSHPRLNLVFVGSPGWEHEAIFQRCKPWLERGVLHLLSQVPAEDLRLLYRHAAVTVCPSFGEGFDFAGVEAMASGGLVAASDIPVHREVYRDAAVYFNPYDPRGIAATLEQLMATHQEKRRDVMYQAGPAVAASYHSEQIMPLWAEFLQRVIASKRS